MQKNQKSKTDKKPRKKTQKNKDKPGYCPECGAYVGAFYSCQYCGAKTRHGTKLRILQIGTVIALIIGLVGITYYAQIDPAPKVDIGDIGPTYSYGIVTIEGDITDLDYTVADDESWSMLLFTVEDDTGAIEVKAYTETTEELIEAKNTPALKDHCEVRGSIYIRGDDLYLNLESSAHFKPIRKEDFSATAYELSEMYNESSSDVLGKRAKINGTVSWVDSSNTYFTLNGMVTVYFPEYIRQFSPDKSLTLIEGDFVEVKGIVKEYYGEPEIIPSSLYDVEIITDGGSS
ncbi:MAG: hypothetical protein ACOC44_03435 [Promethearchaeia archaeon]